MDCSIEAGERSSASAWTVTWSASVAAVAGRATRPFSSHQAVNRLRT